jgi:hypothetical protein
MKNVPLAVSAILATITLMASPLPSHALSVNCSGDHVRWAEHHDPADARFAITTEDGKVTLLLTDRDVAVQLSDHMVHRVKHKLRDKVDDQDDPLAMAIVTAVAGTVRELIDDSFECRLRDLRDVSYQGGRLRFTSREGKPVFEDTDLCDTDVMSSFSERDARHFVEQFRRIKNGS